VQSARQLRLMSNAPIAAVFDMDGTLVDNMGHHADAWIQIARRHGVMDVTVEHFEQHFAGKKNEEIFPELLQREIPADELAAYAWEKEALYRSLATSTLAPVPGLLEFLAALKAARVPMAIATAAPKENRTLVIELFGLDRFVDVVVGAEDVVRGKPAPDIFLKAAHTLGIDPARCVAFEDAKNGVLSAKAAGMAVVGVLTTTPAPILEAAGCFCTLTSYAERPAVLDARLFV
jgi:beta-phosphoglucomutase family hydrolase